MDLANTSAASQDGDAPSGAVAPGGGGYRWKICALLFFATTVNYVDRQVLGILAPVLQKSIGWNEAQYGYIVMAFQTAYALSLFVTGRFLDRIGVRKGYTISVLIWSVASMAHGLARSAFGFGVARFMLGIGEGGNFPAAIKTVSEWFPKQERALAIGIFNSGSNVGALIAPMAVPLIALRFGWQYAFLATGATDLLWLLCWLTVYRRPAEHPRLSRRELAYIQSGTGAAEIKVPWSQLLGKPQTWAFALGKFLTDPVWWFYLFWLPKFLVHWGLTMSKIGLPLVAIYLAADFGSIGGGWLSSSLLKRRWSANAARKTAMLVCACCALPVLLIPHITQLWVVIALIGLATAGHQGWSANLFATVSDMYPQEAVGSVTGIGGTFGAVGGILMAGFAGWVLQTTGSYSALFVVAALAYLAALAVIHLLVPRLAPAKIAVP